MDNELDRIWELEFYVQLLFSWRSYTVNLFRQLHNNFTLREVAEKDLKLILLEMFFSNYSVQILTPDDKLQVHLIMLFFVLVENLFLITKRVNSGLVFGALSMVSTSLIVQCMCTPNIIQTLLLFFFYELCWLNYF